MRFFDLLTDDEEREAVESRVEGVVIGIVTNNEDPEGLGRVKVKFPWMSMEDESNWARIASPMGGNDRGLYFLPEVEDEVLVAFEHGDMRFPYIVGSLWNGKDKPPTTNEDGNNNIRVIKSRSGHVIRLVDEEGAEKIEIIDKTGSNGIVIDTSNNTVSIRADGDIIFSANQGAIKFEAQKVELNSAADTKVESGSGMDIKSGGVMNIKGSIVNIN